MHRYGCLLPDTFATTCPQANSYHSQLGPAEAQHKKLQQSLRAQDNELVRSHTALKLAEKSVQEKEAFIQGLKTELWEAKRGNVHRQALLDAVGHDIFHVSLLSMNSCCWCSMYINTVTMSDKILLTCTMIGQTLQPCAPCHQTTL